MMKMNFSDAMIFSDAINVHMDWFAKFQAAIELGGSPQLDVETIGLDNVCALGKWLYSEFEGYSDRESYLQLQFNHASFHQEASKIARLINENNPDAARSMLSSSGAFFRASRRVIMSIDQCCKEFSAAIPEQLGAQ